MLWRSRIPALDDALCVAASEQLVFRIELAAVVFRASRALERALEAALLEVEAKDLVSGADKVEIARRVVVVKVAPVFRYADLVVFAVLGMELHVAVVVQEDELE